LNKRPGTSGKNDKGEKKKRLTKKSRLKVEKKACRRVKVSSDAKKKEKEQPPPNKIQRNPSRVARTVEERGSSGNTPKDNNSGEGRGAL